MVNLVRDANWSDEQTQAPVLTLDDLAERRRDAARYSLIRLGGHRSTRPGAMVLYVERKPGLLRARACPALSVGSHKPNCPDPGYKNHRTA